MVSAERGADYIEPLDRRSTRPAETRRSGYVLDVPSAARAQADPGESVARYLARLRRRAAALHAVRALIGALAAGGVVFAVAALAVGPLGNAWIAAIVWAAIAGAVGAAVYWVWRGFAPLRGAGAARLLGEVAPELPSSARSAFELERDPPSHASEAMIRAHAAQVTRELRFVRPGHVVRWGTLLDRGLGAAVVAVLFAAMLLGSERGAAGAYALVHPGERDAEGERVAVAFSGVSARLTYPSYLAREPIEVLDPTVLEVPRGTSVEIRADDRVDANAASLRVAESALPMERGEDGEWFVRFVVRADSDLVLRARQPGGEWVRDATRRTVRSLADETPVVSLTEPVEDLVVDELSEIPLRWEASDDVGLASVDLVVRGVDGSEQRRRIASYPEGATPPQTAGAAQLDLALQALNRGESVSLWFEARDGDVVGGPNIGRSRELSVTLASEATRREQRLADLGALLDAGIHTLGDRLERPVPEADTEALDRFESLRTPTEDFVDALREHAQRMREEGGSDPPDIALLREMASRVRRLLHEERVAHGRRPSGLEARAQLDARFVTELEDDVLQLDDLLADARIADAAELAHELESIRREIHSLLQELLRTNSDEARQRLLAAVARAQARMRELMQRIGEMGTNVPREFMNSGGEMPAGETQDALSSLREAVQRGDLSRAQELVGSLRSQIDQLAQALGQTGEQFAESRGFSARDRAMANAMETLEALESEQRRLAERGTERRSRAARRALEAIGGQDNRIGRRLAQSAEAIRRAMREVERDHLSGFEQDGYDRATQRLRDTEDALRAGDLGEARAMAEAAQRDLSALSRDLDLSALMFPGHEGETSDDAQRARQADRDLSSLRRELDESLPDVASHLERTDRSQMREDLGSQREATGAAEGLAEQFAQGPDGQPLSEEAARGVGDAAEAMRQAQESLEDGDPLDSARQQSEAARQLQELREELQRQQQGGGGGGSSGSQMDYDRPVDIPGADEFEGPMELRRRLLDAMREPAPSGYEDAVRRYYEGLLR